MAEQPGDPGEVTQPAPGPDAGESRATWWSKRALVGLLLVILVIVGIAFLARFEYAPIPDEARVINPQRAQHPAYDVWGQSISHEQAQRLLQTEVGRRFLSPENGAVRIDDDLLELGRRAFYEETFDSEYFLTDVLGVVEGRPSPGLGQSQRLPTWPRGSALVPHSIIVSREGHPVCSHVNAMSAFQNTLVPPEPPIERDPALRERGRAVFEAAGCLDCHSGRAYTNNRIIPASVIGTEPERAKALADSQASFDPRPMIFPWNTPVPVPANVPPIEVPLTREPEQIAMAFGHDGEGGYKVKGLIGLYWSAPYLHMGDVAVGPDVENDLGLPDTLLRDVLPDPHNSLLALIDRNLRQRVIAANRAHADMAELNVLGYRARVLGRRSGWLFRGRPAGDHPLPADAGGEGGRPAAAERAA